MREHNGHMRVFLSIVFKSHSVLDMDKNIFKNDNEEGRAERNFKNKV